jgi:hypothetical protein
MWTFDNDADISAKEAVDYVNEGGLEALKAFPDVTFEKRDVILALSDAGYFDWAVEFCSEKLLTDVEFVKELAHYAKSFNKDHLLERLSDELHTSDELLDILSSKVSYIHVVHQDTTQVLKGTITGKM